LNIPVKSTSAILAYKALDRNVGKFWIDWAVEMLMNGFNSEYLIILAGISSPYDQFELQTIAEKVFNELGLDYSDKYLTIKNYVAYLCETGLEESLNIDSTLKILRKFRDLYLDLDYDYLQYFYCLYYGVEDLQYDVVQWYVDGLDRSNIFEVVKDYFRKWIDENHVLKNN